MAVIYVSPATNITEFIASVAVTPGDVLVLEDGVYNQVVIIEKSNLRIVTKGCQAIFNGGNILASAFVLNGVTGVEIKGFKILDYIAHGIFVSGGAANRILDNSIKRVSGDGIRVSNSQANLIWKNEIKEAFDGVELISGSAGNRVIENYAANCRDDGFESFLPSDRDNTFTGNVSQDNGGNGLEIFGENNLVQCNVSKRNVNAGLYIVAGRNIIALNNEIESNRSDGILVSDNNCFIANNQVKSNGRIGINVSGNNNIVQNNIIAFNKNNGLNLQVTSSTSFIFENEFVCNTPANIVNNGVNNNFLENEVKKCKK
jgi:parallel beta-helix repeat protein